MRKESSRATRARKAGEAAHHLHAVLLHTAAGFEVSANAFASSLLELRELSAAGLDDRLDFLFGLLGDGNHSVQILIHKKAHKHLQREWRRVGEMDAAET